MTQKEFERRKAIIEYRNKEIEQEHILRELKKVHRKKSNKPSMSKAILLMVLFFCIEIAIFAEVFMWHFGDSSALYALIGIPAALIPIVIAYYVKAKAENTVGGIVYDMAMMKEHEEWDGGNNEL